MSVAGNRVFAGEDSWILPDKLHLERTLFYWYPCPGFAGKSVSVQNRNLFYGSRVIGNLKDDIVFGVCIGTVESLLFWGLTNVGQLLSSTFIIRCKLLRVCISYIIRVFRTI